MLVRSSRSKRRGIAALKNSAGVSVTSTKGKLMKHYQGLGTCSVYTAFDDSLKEEVDKKVSEFSSLSADGEGSVLYIGR